MKFLELEVPAIKNYKGVVCKETTPNFRFESLITELNLIEDKLQFTSPYPKELKLGSFVSPINPSLSLSPTSPQKPDFFLDGEDKNERSGGNKSGAFVIRVPFNDGDDEEEEEEEEEKDEVVEEKEEAVDSTGMELVTTGTRFSCGVLDLSESEASDDKSTQLTDDDNLMRKTSLEEGVLYELERENQLNVKEEVRKRVSRLEADMRGEYAKTAEAILQIEKRAEFMREIDRRRDKDFQSKIAENLDYHLSIVQRNHQRRSQKEELQIRKDAAIEDAKRKAKDLHDKKIQKEEAVAKAKAEVELKAKMEAARKAEETQKAALDAEAIKASKEAEEKERINKQKDASVGVLKNPQTAGVKVKAAESAIKTETAILQKYIKMTEHNSQFSVNIVKECDNVERQISKRLRQVIGTVESVRGKANDLVSIIVNPQFPQSLSIMIFAKKVIALCDNPSGSFEGSVFAYGHAIVLVFSQVPGLMDFVLAEFYKVCIYTVPKYIQALGSAAKTKDYWMMIGYREENDKLETSEKYLRRIEACMMLYGAIIQTEILGVENLLGLKEGWSWMARFLNEIPATAPSATALHAFLKMAGFSLLRKYKVQFKKLLNVITRLFLPALKAQENPNHASIINKLELYIGKQLFLKEPEGRRLKTHLSSREFV